MKYKVESFEKFNKIRFVNIISIYLNVLKTIFNNSFFIKLNLFIINFTFINTLY